MRRRQFLSLPIPLIASSAMPAFGESDWPGKAIRIICPFPAGGQVDVAARIVAEKISPLLGQSIFIEPKTGADGNIGTELAAKSPPDGYTWLVQAVPFTVMPSLRPKTLRYDPIRDFEAVAMLGTSPLVYVVPSSLSVTTLAEFLTYAKARPGQISYGGSSRGSLAHLGAEMLKDAAGIKMEMISYAGMPPALSDLISQRTQFMSLGLPVALPFISSGKLRALAVLDPQRNKKLPDVPTIAEAGFPQLVTRAWFGLFMPAHTPSAIVNRINDEVVKVLQSPDVIQKYESVGIDAAKPEGPQAFESFVQGDVIHWGKVIRATKIETD